MIKKYASIEEIREKRLITFEERTKEQIAILK